jgi:ATP-dependent Clp protease adaptor protein ClpS
MAHPKEASQCGEASLFYKWGYNKKPVFSYLYNYYYFCCIRYFMSFSASYSPLTEVLEETDVLTESTTGYNLILWNDEVNTFEWVIETLIEICGHSAEQAEQCAMLIHHKGKYAVKTGSYEVLKPQCDAINDRLINATIEELVS